METLNGLDGWRRKALASVLSRRRTTFLGKVITSGSELYAAPKSDLHYHQQLAYINDEEGLLEQQFRPGQVGINAGTFFSRADMGNNAWMKMALELNNIETLYSQDTDDPDYMTHQAGMLHALCSSDSKWQTVICSLPHLSGRTTTALLAMFYTLVERLGSVLFISPNESAAQIVASRVESFLEHTHWYRGITLTRFYDISLQREISNVGIATPQALDDVLLPENDKYAEYLADVELVILDSTEQYFGTFGTHAGLIFRRLRRVLEKRGAQTKYFATVAPQKRADSHVRQLLGVDEDSVHRQRVKYFGPGSDSLPRPQRVMALWAPPLRWKGPDQTTPVNSLSLTREGLSDGMQGLLRALSSALGTHSRLPQGTAPNTIVILSQDLQFTYNDAESLMTADRWKAHVVGSLNELDADELSGSGYHYDKQVLLVAGFPGSLATLMHQVAHYGDEDALIIVALGTDPLSQYLLRNARASTEALVSSLRVSEGKNGMSVGADDLHSAPGVIPLSQQRLALNMSNHRMLQAHLWRAAHETGGITEEEAHVFFGMDAVRVLELNPDLFVQGAEGDSPDGGTIVYHPRERRSRPTIDLHCVDWTDSMEEQKLIPVRPATQGHRPVGHIEVEKLSSVVFPFSAQVFGGRRYIFNGVPDGVPEYVTGRRSGYVEYRERLSQLGIDIVQVHGRKLQALGQNTGTQLCLETALADLSIEETVVGYSQYDGYSHFEDRTASLPGCEPSRFQTKGLVLRIVDNVSREVIHAIKHCIKTALPMLLRYDTAELEIVMGFDHGTAPETEGIWHIVFYDNHPYGDLYSRALQEFTPEDWGSVFRLGYQILESCPCSNGCWHCLKLPDCRDALETAHTRSHTPAWLRNQGLDKRGAFDYLGQRLDIQNHGVNMYLKFGEGECQGG